MIIEFVCKNYDPSDKLKDVIDKKFNVSISFSWTKILALKCCLSR